MLVLGVVYTLKVIDIILGLTRGGPANATQTIATQSYHLSFVEFDFGQGAAMGNILIVVSLVFATLYLRASRERRPMTRMTSHLSRRRPPPAATRARRHRHTFVGVADPRRVPVPAVLDAQRLAAASRAARSRRRGSRPTSACTATRRRCTTRAATCSTSLVIALGSVIFSLLIAAPAAYALAQLGSAARAWCCW